MGRPKLYEDRAEKMRAYRARRSGRVVEVDRSRVESMDDRLTRLRAAVRAAQDVGNEIAQGIDTVTLEDTLDGLTALFEMIAAAAVEQETSGGKRNKSNVTIPEPSRVVAGACGVNIIERYKVGGTDRAEGRSDR